MNKIIIRRSDTDLEKVKAIGEERGFNVEQTATYMLGICTGSFREVFEGKIKDNHAKHVALEKTIVETELALYSEGLVKTEIDALLKERLSKRGIIDGETLPVVNYPEGDE